MIKFPYEVNSLKLYKIKGGLYPDELFIADANDVLQEFGVNYPSLVVEPIKELFKKHGWKEGEFATFGMIWVPPVTAEWEETRFSGRDYFAGWNDLLRGGLLWWAELDGDTWIASPRELIPLKPFEVFGE